MTATRTSSSSTSQARLPPYRRFRAPQHKRLRNRSLAHQFSIRFLSDPGKDQMLSEAEYMLIATTRTGVERAHIASDIFLDGWDTVYVDEGQRRLVYSDTLHLALAALWFCQDVEEMVKEARRNFSGLPETAVRLWHAELSAHWREPSGNGMDEEDADTPMENTYSQDVPPFRSTREEHANTSSSPPITPSSSSSNSPVIPPSDSNANQEDRNDDVSSFSRDSPGKRPAVKWMPLEDLAETVVSAYVCDNREALTSIEHPDYLMSNAKYESLHAAVCASHPEMPTEGPLYREERRLVYRKIAPQALAVLECRDNLVAMLLEAETKFVGLPEKLVTEWQACVSRVNVRRVTKPRNDDASTGTDSAPFEDTFVGSESDSSISPGLSSSTLSDTTLVELDPEDTEKKTSGGEDRVRLDGSGGVGSAAERSLGADMLLMRGFRLLRRLPFAWMEYM